MRLCEVEQLIYRLCASLTSSIKNGTFLTELLGYQWVTCPCPEWCPAQGGRNMSSLFLHMFSKFTLFHGLWKPILFPQRNIFFKSWNALDSWYNWSFTKESILSSFKGMKSQNESNPKEWGVLWTHSRWCFSGQISISFIRDITFCEFEIAFQVLYKLILMMQ